MDAIVANIQGLSGNAGDLGQLLAYLKNQVPFLANNVDTIIQAVHTLDPAQHSLGMLWLLEAFSRHGGQAATEMGFIDLIASFFTACTPAQIRLAPEAFVKLGRKFREVLMSAQSSRKGILPMQSAVRALQPSTEHLTPLHAEFFLLCLASKCYNAASQLLSEDIYHVDPSQTACTPKDLFLYCRYGSMLCIGRKQWSRAAELQMCALCAPSVAGNAIVLDCYKQYVLVCLIANGTLPPLPKIISSVVRNMCESEARQYNELASAYVSHNPTKMTKIVEQNAAVYTTDNNFGLVSQVVDSLVARNIQRLTTTYLTLSLADIAQQVGLPSADAAEQQILRMVAAGDVFAVISEEDGGMVRFGEDPESFDSPAAATRLADAVAQCTALSKRVSATQHVLALHKDYLKKVAMKDTQAKRFDGTEELAALTGAGAAALGGPGAALLG